MCRAASEAGRLAVKMRRCRAGEFIRTKSRQNLVNEADVGAELLIREAIADLFPSEPVLGGEHRLVRDSIKGHWVVDPTDGKANHLCELSDRAVPFTHRKGENILFDVIHSPESGEATWARVGGGCHLNSLPASASPCDAPSCAIVLTDCSNRSFREGCPAPLDVVMDDGMACRHIGSGPAA